MGLAGEARNAPSPTPPPGPTSVHRALRTEHGKEKGILLLLPAPGSSVHETASRPCYQESLVTEALRRHPSRNARNPIPPVVG